jgi:hypothetical protein
MHKIRLLRAQIWVTEKRKPFYHFITTLCAIVVSTVRQAGCMFNNGIHARHHVWWSGGHMTAHNIIELQGGVFVVAGIIDGLLHSSHRLLAKKLDLGKQG